jgi:NCAIR mutase (PurE)-related protein
MDTEKKKEIYKKEVVKQTKMNTKRRSKKLVKLGIRRSARIQNKDTVDKTSKINEEEIRKISKVNRKRRN